MAADQKQFSGSRLKIQRANRHISDLATIFNAFLQSDFCQLRVEKDPNGRNEVLKLVSVASLPADVPLIMGDAVHNLRSALDYVTRQLFGADNERVTFPLVKKREDLENSSAMGLVKKVFPDLAKFIIAKIETHDTGHPSIWAAGRLDNIDKHKLLIPIVSVQAIHDISFINEESNIRGTGNSFTVSEGRVLNAISMPPPVKITGYGKPTAQILFAEGQPLEGQPVIPCLVQISQRVSQTVEALEAFCFR
jgi:hypothetical protein